MRQALDLRDSGVLNPALYAARALEGAVKIASRERGWLPGRERGAAQAIDTLVSRKNGGMVAPWEGEMLKRFFADVRTPDAHGAGSEPQPKLDASRHRSLLIAYGPEWRCTNVGQVTLVSGSVSV